MSEIADETRATLDHLLAQQELLALVNAYSRAADHADEETMAALFHPGAVIDSGVFRGDGPSFAREFAQWVRGKADVVFHAVAQSTFQINGDCATGVSYVVAMCRMNSANGGGESITGGRYMDRFEKRDGAWKFTERLFVPMCTISP